jgi:hypothetical protein
VLLGQVINDAAPQTYGLSEIERQTRDRTVNDRALPLLQVAAAQQ